MRSSGCEYATQRSSCCTVTSVVYPHALSQTFLSLIFQTYYFQTTDQSGKAFATAHESIFIFFFWSLVFPCKADKKVHWGMLSPLGGFPTSAVFQDHSSVRRCIAAIPSGLTKYIHPTHRWTKLRILLPPLMCTREPCVATGFSCGSSDRTTVRCHRCWANGSCSLPVSLTHPLLGPGPIHFHLIMHCCWASRESKCCHPEAPFWDIDFKLFIKKQASERTPPPHTHPTQLFWPRDSDREREWGRAKGSFWGLFLNKQLQINTPKAASGWQNCGSLHQHVIINIMKDLNDILNFLSNREPLEVLYLCIIFNNSLNSYLLCAYQALF